MYIKGLGDPDNKADIDFREGCGVNIRLAAEIGLYLPGEVPIPLIGFKVAHKTSIPIMMVYAHLFGRFEILDDIELLELVYVDP